MGIKQNKSRVIFIRRNEYKMKSKGFRTQLESSSLSPLFKVDGIKDTYKMGVSFSTMSLTYLIKKTDEGWIIDI